VPHGDSLPTFEELERYAPDASLYVAASSPIWLDELDLKPAPPHLKMGTRSLDVSTWLAPDQFRDGELALKRRLFADRPDAVFACLPHAEGAAREAAQVIGEWMHLHAGVTIDWSMHAHPLAAVSLHTQEDLALMVFRDGDWHLDALSLCFPSLWRLSDKIGRSTGAVHGPVRHYDTDLSRKVDTFFSRLKPETPVWRRNLTVKPYPFLHLPTPALPMPPNGVVVAPDGSPLWLRSERQTLRALPDSGALLFTIRVQMTPARHLRERRDIAAQMLAMFDSWGDPHTMQTPSMVDAFVPWLRSITT
jgi:hypothetical protein